MSYVLSLDCALIVAVSLLGGMMPLATVLTHTRLQAYLSFSAGSMLGAAFFHMLPEAVRMGTPQTIRWSALGLLSLFFLERFFSFHHHEPQDPASEPPTMAIARRTTRNHHHLIPTGMAMPRPRRFPGGRRPLVWPSIPWSAAWHSQARSRPTSPSAEGSGATGWGVFLATVLHKPADALTIVSLMLRSGVPRRRAHLVNFGFALMIPAGVVLFALGLGQLVAAGGVIVDSCRPVVLRGYLPLHRPERPPAGAAVPFA